ncbi:MAG: hypothetical protein IT453_22730 [Planctomycetes bacterium]|nr:hypothetical protein [Planctomycetota bacterium]
MSSFCLTILQVPTVLLLASGSTQMVDDRAAPTIAAAPVVPTPAEVAVDTAVASALQNWAFVITSHSSQQLGVVTAATEQRWIDIVLGESFYATVTDAAPAQLAALQIRQDPSLTTADTAKLREYLDLVIDPTDVIVRTTWVSPTAGLFETYAVCSGIKVEYDAFLSLMPKHWPQVFPPQPQSHSNSWPGAGLSYFDTNFVGGKLAEYNLTAVALCDGPELIGCSSEFTAVPLFPTWDVKGAPSSQSNGNCCTATCMFGFANGFKKVKVSGGGGAATVEIDGLIGSSGTFQKTVTSCCPER